MILGVLASIALPKIQDTKNLADIAAGRSDVATIRSAIVSERQTQIVKGIYTWIPSLSSGTGNLFMGDGTRKLLMYGIATGAEWTRGTSSSTTDTYTFTVDGTTTTFIYDNSDGTFSCSRNKNDCNALVD